MKKVLVLGLLMFLGVSGVFAYTEINDVNVSSECTKVVTISSTAWTPIFTNPYDVFRSTTVTGNNKNSYQILYYTIRNDSNADTDVYLSVDNTIAATDVTTTCWMIRDTEVMTYNSPLTRYARLAAGGAAPIVTATLRVEKSYYGTR